MNKKKKEKKDMNDILHNTPHHGQVEMNLDSNIRSEEKKTKE
ncbi:hypothetical protein ACERII_06815 [Evansella sp. AB-rgal1]